MYYRQLDSVRTLAVLLVIIYHWAPDIYALRSFGSWGVGIFFVLSGFLITKTLLESRLSASTSGISQFNVLGNFLARRALRIFPLYYLSLFIILFFDKTNISGLHQNWPWFFSYTSNLLFFKTQKFNYPLAHFWSLSVEEQFYLVWPWFVLFLPVGFLKNFFIITVASGIAARVILGKLFSAEEVPVNILTPACFDLFSIGGLFAFYIVAGKNILRMMPVINLAGVISLIIVACTQIFQITFLASLQRTLEGLSFLMLIANAYIGIKGFAGKIADSKILIYLGKISYGLYVYHLITPWLTIVFFNIILKFHAGILSIAVNYYYKHVVCKAVVDSLVLVAVASLSWYIFEKPINNLKKFFKKGHINMVVPVNVLSS